MRQFRAVQAFLSRLSTSVIGQHYYLLVGAVSLFVYLGIAWFVLEPAAVWSPDTGAKLLQLQSLRLEDGRFSYDIVYPERYLDPYLQFVDVNSGAALLNRVGEEVHFRRLPLFSLLNLPFFRLLGAYGLYILPALGGAVIGYVTLRLWPQPSNWALTWLLVAFGGPVFIYSVLFWEHTPAAALALIAAWWSFRAAPMCWRKWNSLLPWVGIAFLFVVAAYLRLETTIFAGAFLASAWLMLPERRRSLILVGIVVISLMLFYRPLHDLLFAQPLPDNAAYIYRPGAYLEAGYKHALSELLVGPPADEALATGWRGTAMSITALVALVSGFASGRYRSLERLQLLALFIVALISGTFLFSGQTYRSAHGLLFTTPWLLLALCWLPETWRQESSRQLRVVMLTLILGLTGYAVAILGFRGSSPHGGLEWGARFAIIFYPLAAPLVTGQRLFERSGRARVILAGLFIYLGLWFQLRGLITIRWDKAINHELNQILMATSGQQVVSDIWWLRYNAAPILGCKEIYLISGSQALEQWRERATEYNVAEFSLVTQNPDIVEGFVGPGKSTSMVREPRQYGVFYHYDLRFQLASSPGSNR